MGEAKRRGSCEERKLSAEERQRQILKACCERDAERGRLEAAFDKAPAGLEKETLIKEGRKPL